MESTPHSSPSPSLGLLCSDALHAQRFIAWCIIREVRPATKAIKLSEGHNDLLAPPPADVNQIIRTRLNACNYKMMARPGAAPHWPGPDNFQGEKKPPAGFSAATPTISCGPTSGRSSVVSQKFLTLNRWFPVIASEAKQSRNRLKMHEIAASSRPGVTPRNDKTRLSF
jgi:hypothetical protein